MAITTPPWLIDVADAEPLSLTQFLRYFRRAQKKRTHTNLRLHKRLPGNILRAVSGDGYYARDSKKAVVNNGEMIKPDCIYYSVQVGLFQFLVELPQQETLFARSMEERVQEKARVVFVRVWPTSKHVGEPSQYPCWYYLDDLTPVKVNHKVLKAALERSS